MSENPSDTTNAQPTETPDELGSFFTRARANEGIKLPLALPDGTPSEHWIRIRGVDSDHFRAADAAARRRMADDLAVFKDDSKAQQLLERVSRELIAELVIEWSFKTPCTRENVLKLLTEAPQIAQEIDTLAARRRLFFKQGSTSS